MSAVVASYNVHGGVDGFGRPFDVVGACRQVDADVLVLQETWSPDEGRSLAHRVGDTLGYHVEELAMARGQLTTPSPGEVTTTSWGPLVRRRGPYGLRVGGRPARRASPLEAVVGTRQRGTLGLAVLSRLPLRGASRLSLGQLLRDPSMRGAIVVEVELPDGLLTVVGTHLAHLSNGSLIQLRALRRLIPGPATPAVLAGDMNLWGPPLSAMLPGWSRTVRARSWPAWRPMAQLDHVLVTPALRVDGRGEVLALGGSDHLPVRSRLSLR